ncbi:ROK family protein [Leptolyngbya sp. AN02str]|uniref:ROK family protein n=1 Tax=Leptolyngbya sp. AN02str TaxID=3423363 RepID=UPI003D31F885
MGTEPNAGQVLGVDLGGTAIKLGRFDSIGTCLQSLTVPTPQPAEPRTVLEAIVNAIAQVDPHHDAIAIGIGTPGPTDGEGRVARVAINLGWENVPLADWMEATLGKPTILANDANCAGLGEAWLGAGRRFTDVILLTLGTGVGGAVILDGKLFVGRNGTAGELGLMTIDREGIACNSGNCGSLEQHVSVQAIRRMTGMEPAQMSDRAKAGDLEAIAFWQNYGRDLGAGLANLIYIFTPEAVILSGGISASSELFFPTMWDEIKLRVLPTSREDLQILTADLGNQAGMVGAAKLAWQLVEQRAAQLQANAATRQPPSAPSALALSDPALSELELVNRMVVELAKFKAGFLARTSHELRSPLNGILGMHQLILSDLCDSPDEEREFIQQAYHSTHKLLGLLDEVIHVSKVDHGSTQLQIQPVQVASLLDDLQMLTHLQAQNRSIQLEIATVDPELYVLADPHWLKQGLLYVIDSAIALMQEGTVRLTAQVEPSSRQFHFEIEDSRSPSAWHEAVNYIHTPVPMPALAKEHLKNLPEPSFLPGMTLLIAQQLFECMQGSLRLVEAPSADRPGLLRCTLPLANDEL